MPFGGWGEAAALGSQMGLQEILAQRELEQQMRLRDEQMQRQRQLDAINMEDLFARREDRQLGREIQREQLASTREYRQGMAQDRADRTALATEAATVKLEQAKRSAAVAQMEAQRILNDPKAHPTQKRYATVVQGYAEQGVEVPEQILRQMLVNPQDSIDAFRDRREIVVQTTPPRREPRPYSSEGERLESRIPADVRNAIMENADWYAKNPEKLAADVRRYYGNRTDVDLASLLGWAREQVAQAKRLLPKPKDDDDDTPPPPPR